MKQGEVDLLFGGPPCQGYSQIGTRVLDDPRNEMYLQYVRMLSTLQPRVFIMENVPNMLLHGQRPGCGSRRGRHPESCDRCSVLGTYRPVCEGHRQLEGTVTVPTVTCLADHGRLAAMPGAATGIVHVCAFTCSPFSGQPDTATRSG